MTRSTICLTLLLAAPLVAQEPPPSVPAQAAVPYGVGAVVRPGDRVRLRPRAPDTPGTVGRWLGADAGRARVEVASAEGRLDTALVSLADLASLERSTGRGTRLATGAGVGAFVGLAAGVAAGLAEGDDPPGFVSFSAGDKALIYGLGGAGLGAVVGMVIGYTIKSDTWQVVPLQRMPGGVGPGLTLRF
jgi:hypothetical protein